MHEIKHISNFKVEVKAPKITIFNQEEFENSLDIYLEKYKGLIVTPETYKADKATRAELNRIKKAIDNNRIALKKQYTAPFKEMEDLLKSYTQKIDQVNEGIKQGCAKYEEDQRQKRKTHVMSLLKLACEQEGVSIDLVEFNDKWLNKSKTEPQIKKEISEAIEKAQRLQSDFQLIEKMSAEKGLPVGPYKSICEQEGALSAISQMDQDFKAEQERKAAAKQAEQAIKQAEKEKVIATTTDIGDHKRINNMTGEVVQELQTVTFTLKGTKEQLDSIARLVKLQNIQVIKASERVVTYE